ncbi:hypothetical protein LSH36_107g12026 [Paralvinella palmiformis]|uniref:Uncharacterized protein n=1 Tax=Paralvinella palmiformis TaxID=53620 RepID=A0AAD9JZ83_9ANNE|nr:hypothetical protein LSH36_107g12026 [Paralvinella palmiformis]
MITIGIYLLFTSDRSFYFQLSEWGKHDAKLIDALNKGDTSKINSVLTKKGISPTKQDPSGLSVAGYWDITNSLMNVQDAPLNKANDKGETPLHLAAANDHIKVCEELLRNGARVNSQDINHRTPLMLAAARGNIRLVQLFVDSRANLLLEDKKGHTAMWYAANAAKSDVEAYLNNVIKSGDVYEYSAGQNGSDSESKEPTINGHDEVLDVHTSVEPINDEESSDDESGFVVPIDQHPSTSNKEPKPQYLDELVNTTKMPLPQSKHGGDVYKDKISEEIAGNFEKEEPITQVRPTTSERDLHELSAFGDIQEAHEKEIDDYCDENQALKFNQERMNNELSGLQDHVARLRVGTQPANVDVEELIQNRATVDQELMHVEQLEQLRKENWALKADNADLQSSVIPIRSEIANLQELVDKNRKVTRENGQLQYDNTELRRQNDELLAENARLTEENNKLLSQVAQIQKDIENSMSKLPSIDEFLATREENEKMKTTMARLLDALRNAAREKEDLKQNIEDLTGKTSRREVCGTER